MQNNWISGQRYGRKQMWARIAVEIERVTHYQGPLTGNTQWLRMFSFGYNR